MGQTIPSIKNTLRSLALGAFAAMPVTAQAQQIIDHGAWSRFDFCPDRHRATNADLLGQAANFYTKYPWDLKMLFTLRGLMQEAGKSPQDVTKKTELFTKINQSLAADYQSGRLGSARTSHDASTALFLYAEAIADVLSDPAVYNTATFRNNSKLGIINFEAKKLMDAYACSNARMYERQDYRYPRGLLVP